MQCILSSIPCIVSSIHTCTFPGLTDEWESTTSTSIPPSIIIQLVVAHIRLVISIVTLAISVQYGSNQSSIIIYYIITYVSHNWWHMVYKYYHIVIKSGNSSHSQELAFKLPPVFPL